MLILVALSFTPLLVEALVGYDPNSEKSKKRYLCICGLLIVLVIGLRSRYSGSYDSNTYCTLFESARRYTSLDSFLNFAVPNSNTSWLFSEYGFFGCVFLLSRIFSSPQWLLLFSSLAIVACTMRFIRLNSEDLCLSVTLYITLGLMTFCMNGMRQGLAMSLCLLAFEPIKNRKFLRFLLIVFLAMMFHKTAFLILPLYFVTYIQKINWKSLLLILACAVLLLALLENLVVISDNLFDKNYADDTGLESGGYVTVFIYLIVLLLCCFVSPVFQEDVGRKYRIGLCMVISGFCLYISRYVSSAIFERASYYFFYGILLLFPGTIQAFEQKSRFVVRTLILLTSIALFTYRINSSGFSNFTLFFLS